MSALCRPITDNILGFLLRPAGLNGQKDALGHGLLEIYINPQLNISTCVKGHIDSALNTLIASPALATPGFFTATLIWDGAGDVDLHTDKPAGAYVASVEAYQLGLLRDRQCVL